MLKSPRILAAICLTVIGASCADAMGRKPGDDDKDRFPDYNRIEMHSASKVDKSTATVQEAGPVKTPAARSEATSKGDDNTYVPKPPPKAVPMASAEDSEPPLEMPSDASSTNSVERSTAP